MRSLRTREAATLLNVSPNTLRTWERKFGYPAPQRSQGRHRAYAYGEIVALRDALQGGLSVESAISVVREGLGADTEALVSAIVTFDLTGADRAMEASLALRSMERSVTEVLLPALDLLRRRDGAVSTRWAVGQQWGLDWLGRAQRLGAPPEPGPGIVVGDATLGRFGSAAHTIRAFELFCSRARERVLVLPVGALATLQEALATVEPACVIVAGSEASDEQVGRWVYAVRQITGPVATALFARPVRDRPKPSAHVLPVDPAAAHRIVQELIAESSGARRATSAAEANDLAQSR